MYPVDPDFILKRKFHYLFWSAFFIYYYLSNYILNSGFTLTLFGVLNYACFFLTVLVSNFYAIVYYLNILKYKKKSKVVNASSFIVLLLLSVGLALLYRRYIQPVLIHNSSPINYAKYIVYWFFQFTYSSMLASGYFFVKELIKEKINSSNLEKEKTTVESNLLRSQINPHFLFNTLNVLYAKSIVYSEDLADKIQKLSEIMRYAYLPKWLQDGSHAPVSEEIKHIHNIISIHEFRLSNKKIFHFKVEGEFGNVFLPPLVLVTLVENILKHGHLTSESPAVALLKHENETFTFQSKNKIKTAKNHDERSGVGVSNIEQRLDRYFKDDFTFNSEEVNGYYYVRLAINLKK